MRRAIKKKCSLYNFLDSCGALENGTDEEIMRARVEYWKAYKREWRRKRRKDQKEFTISFTKHELKRVADEARKYKMCRTGYIKRATLSYLDKIYLVTDLEQVRRITQLLAMNYNCLLQMVKDGQLPSIIGTAVLNKISNLEKDVLIQLNHPKTLEEWIKEEIIKDDSIKERVIKLLGVQEK